MFIKVLCLAAVSALLTGSLFADDEAARVSLAGIWTAPGDATDTWVLEPKGDNIRITHKKGAETVSDFECNTMGKTCKTKEAGKHATVSLWFNGAKLVELQTVGSEVRKRRYSVSADNALEIETILISPAGKTETLQLKRLPTDAAAK